MSYTPTVWKEGDVVTSSKLNKLEKGVADASGGGLVVHLTIGEETVEGIEYWTFTCDKTYKEIRDAAFGGTAVYLEGEGDPNNLTYTSIAKFDEHPENPSYEFVDITGLFGLSGPFSVETVNDYPVQWIPKE